MMRYMLEYGPVKRALALNWTGRWSVQETAFHAGALERLAMKFVAIAQRLDFFDSGFEMSTEPITGSLRQNFPPN